MVRSTSDALESPGTSRSSYAISYKCRSISSRSCFFFPSSAKADDRAHITTSNTNPSRLIMQPILRATRAPGKRA